MPQSIDHATYAKRGFLLGAGLFAVGALGEMVGHAAFGTLPSWNDALLTNMEAFGIVLPLTE